MAHLKAKGMTRMLGIAALLMTVGTSYATEAVGPGSPAPALKVVKWLKGDKIAKLEKDKTYVVEFWATWCGPCVQAMPHVTKLAKENPDVTFLGVGIWEDDVDGVLEAFVEKMGDKIGYNLGYSGNEEGMAETWMKASGQNGIPSAFIVKNGVIQWIGHPMSMDQPLAEVKAGTFDLAAFKAEYYEEMAVQRAQMAARDEMVKIEGQYKEGQRAEAKKALDALVEKYPTLKAQADDIRFGWLGVEDEAAWTKEAEKRAKSEKMNDRMGLYMFALGQTEEGGNIKLGRKAVELALGGKELDAVLENYYAMSFYKELKEYKTAMKHVDALIAAAKKSEMYNNEDALAQFEQMKKDLVTASGENK